MSVLRLAILLLPVLGACAAETPATPLPKPAAAAAAAAAAVSAPEATLTIDRALAASPPGSDRFSAPLDLWADPAAQASRDQVARQISLLLHGKVPATTAFADAFQGLSWEIEPASTFDLDRRHPSYGLLVLHGLAPLLAGAVSGVMPDAKPQTIRGYQGSGNAALFAGARGDHLVVGMPGLLEQRLPEETFSGHEKEPAALTYHFDFTSVLALVKKLEVEGISYNLDPLLPRWRAEAPQLTATIRPDQHGYQGRLTFSARSLPLHEVDPVFAQMLSDGKQVRALMGIAPVAVSQLISNLLSSSDVSALEARIGLPLERAAECFTGDVMLLVQSDGIIPQGCMAFSLQPNTRSKLLATHLAQIWKGQMGASPDPAATLWNLDTPLGPWQLAVSPTRLVFGNDPDLLTRLLHGASEKSTVPPHLAAFLDCDLPRLGKQWLPLLWQLLHDAHLNLSDEPLTNLSFQLPALATALIQAKDAGHPRLSSLLEHPTPTTLGTDGHATARIWATDFPADLRAVLGADPTAHGPELEARLDRSFAVFSDVHQLPVQVVAVVVRKADGFHILETDHGARKAGMTLQQLGPRLGGLHLAMGPALEDLVVLEPLATPRLDLSWLPDAGALAAHLQPYRLEVGIDALGAHAQESGEPLAALLAILSTLEMALIEQPHMLLYQERFNSSPGGSTPAQPPGHTVVEF
jgi:hypothetical protein